MFIITLSSCYENLAPDPILDEVATEETSEIIEGEVIPSSSQSNIELEDQSQPADDSAIFSSLLADMFKAISLASSLDAKTGQIAQIRNSNCPLTYLVSDGVYPDTFYVDFDNCDPSAVFNQKYDGALVFILNGDLDDESICPLFTVQAGAGNEEFFLAPGPTAENNKLIRIEENISFCLTDNTGDDLEYEYQVNQNINVKNMNNGAYTQYPDGMQGNITIKSVENDNIGDATTLIDNTFYISAEPTTISCIASDGEVKDFCIATNPEGLRFRLICGCPETGQLYIQNTSENCNDIISSNSYWDFSYVEPGSNSCENTALDPDNQVSTIPCGQTF